MTGFLPPLIFHLLFLEEATYLPMRRLWRWLLPAFYAISALIAFAHGFNDAGLLSIGQPEAFDILPVMILGAAGILGLLVQLLSRRSLSDVERRHRRWNVILLLLTLFIALLTWFKPTPWVGVLPDYLVLGFFCVILF